MLILGAGMEKKHELIQCHPGHVTSIIIHEWELSRSVMHPKLVTQLRVSQQLCYEMLESHRRQATGCPSNITKSGYQEWTCNFYQ